MVPSLPGVVDMAHFACQVGCCSACAAMPNLNTPTTIKILARIQRKVNGTPKNLGTLLVTYNFPMHIFRKFAVGAPLCAGLALLSQEPPPQLAHFHHVHLNATDPKAAIDFYTSKFDCEKGKFAGALDAVWAQKSWLLFTKAAAPPKSEITSTIWHIGWGAEDMKATYQKQLDSGTKFATPITDIRWW